MEDKICPKASKCPLFKGESVADKESQKIYLKLYCKNGKMGQMECKRFLVSEAYKKPLDSLLPNDPRTIEEIIEQMKHS